MPQPPVGIDLGTTYSAVAYLDATGRPLTIPNSSGDLVTPSALLFEDGEIIVGREAMRESVVSPLAYAECFKRDMGAQAYRRSVRSLQVPPEILSGFLLERLKQDAEARIGPISQVVITVPAFFDETRRKATQDAGKLAGLEVLDIINEPTAAAIAFGWQQKASGAGQAKRRVLVYDLGGGTFDVTILEIEGDQFRALATDGDVQLGGKDWDNRLVDHLAKAFLAQHGVDPRSDPQDAAQLWLDAQEIKHTLSERAKAKAVVHHAGLRLRVEVDRVQFEEMTADLLARTETTTSLVLKDTGLNWSQIDDVLLVGGSSRMPQVAEMLRRLTGKEPNRSASPDEAVAHGAALYCSMLIAKGASAATSYKLVNVNSHSLGVVGLDVQTQRRVNVVLIPKNSSLPCQATKLFRTARAGQRSVLVPVVEGESRRPEDCIALGTCVVRNLPPTLPQGTPIHVTYRYQANGRIAVAAQVPDAGQSAVVEIQREGAQTLEPLEMWRERLGAATRAGAEVRQPTTTTTAAADRPPPPTPSSGASPLPPPPPPPGVAEARMTPAPPPRLQAADRSALIRKLDNVYGQIGRLAVTSPLKGDLERWRQAALDADQQLQGAEQRTRAAEMAQRGADGTPEAVHRASEAARARTEAEQLRKRRDFALVVLGRECVSAKVNLADAPELMSDAERLRGML